MGFQLVYNKIQYLSLIFLVEPCQNLQHSMWFILVYYDSFILACHNLYISAEQKLCGKLTILTHKSMREQNTFHMMHILSISWLKTMEYFYTKLSDTTVNSYSKQIAMSASDYTERAYCALRIFMQLTQCYAFIV